MRKFWTQSLVALSALILWGCGNKQPTGNPAPGQAAAPTEQILQFGNGTEPQDLDPQVVTGVPEFHIVSGLLEGLVGQDPEDLHPVPTAAAEKWDVSDDHLTYTFHLRPNAKWSNGDPVTAMDFVKSYQRMLTASLASEYSYMLFVVKGAQEYNAGTLKDFAETGFKAVDDHTLQVQLKAPTPYFLSLLAHHSWYPVHIPTVEKYGKLYERGNTWTLPGRFVGNGPFMLAEWKQNQIVVLKKSPTYWDAATVKLQEIHFHPIDNEDTEERAYRTGQLDLTETVPGSKVEVYRKEHPEALRIVDYFGTYYYRVNVTRTPGNNKKLRQALAHCIDRQAIIDRITRAGQKPAYSLCPPIAGVYTNELLFSYDPDKGRKLLAEAGYPGGKGCPPVEILFNTSDTHKLIAEAIQQMWKKELNIDVQLQNQEWKVYIDSQRQLNYSIGRYAWIGDYLDPNSFMDMMVTGGGNNQTGWSNADYDRMIHEASVESDPVKRMNTFHEAEKLLMEEMPVIPIYFYTRNHLINPRVKGMHPNILDIHPWKHVYLE